jgi:tetratricopeptide (TPR) repeat protein
MFQQGNIAFIDEDYDDALRFYSNAVEGIGHVSDQRELFLVYSFRAAAHLKLKNFSSALDDCNAALKLNVIKILNKLVK